MQQQFFTPLISTLLLLSSSSVLGFQLLRPHQTSASSLCHRHNTSASSSSRVFLSAASTSSSTTETTITDTEVQTLFDLLADTTLLYDPSRGTCCRNRCSGCTFLDLDGNFLFDEYTTDNNNDEEDDNRGWLAPYVNVDFGERIQTSKWSTLLFPPASSDGSDETVGAKKKKKEVERKEFTTLLDQQLSSSSSSSVSPLAIQSLWNILSPSVGYPRLSSTEIIRAIKGMEGAKSEMGGAVTYNTFAKNLLAAGDQIQQLGGLSEEDDNVVEYDSMEKEDLLDLCIERGMKTNFPKMKRIIIEELRFFDANGRQGKRHPVKNTLS